MTDEGSIADNVSKGRGIVGKKDFRVVGADKQDRETGGHEDPSRGPGRPRVDKNWNEVGPSAEKENG